MKPPRKPVPFLDTPLLSLANDFAQKASAVAIPAQFVNLHPQLSRAATSVLLNAAESVGRGPSGRYQLDVARGSLHEAAAALHLAGIEHLDAQIVELERALGAARQAPRSNPRKKAGAVAKRSGKGRWVGAGKVPGASTKTVGGAKGAPMQGAPRKNAGHRKLLASTVSTPVGTSAARSTASKAKPSIPRLTPSKVTAKVPARTKAGGSKRIPTSASAASTSASPSQALPTALLKRKKKAPRK